VATRRYTWDGRRYRSALTGRYVSPREVRTALDTALRNTQPLARMLADDLRAGRVSRQEWAVRMRELVRSTHLMSSAAARGGWAQMTPEAYGQVGAAVREQYRYLDPFIAEVEAGLPLDGRFTARAAMYAQAGRNTFHRAERAVMLGQGMREERNVLDREAVHCEGPNSCPEQSARGWVPIGNLLPVGSRLCITACRCRMEYRADGPLNEPARAVVATPSQSVPAATIAPPGDTPSAAVAAPAPPSPAPVPDVAKTEAEEFREWFGDSKVVDEDGEPLVVYHGSRNAQIDGFKDGEVVWKLPAPLAESELEGGFFFTPDIEVARAYGTPIPYYLKATRPVRREDPMTPGEWPEGADAIYRMRGKGTGIANAWEIAVRDRSQFRPAIRLSR
jgi:hypothetical protein